MSRFSLNEPDPAPGEVNPDHEAEDIRQHDWEEYQQSTRCFAELYGWPAACRALAQAMDDDARIRRELMDRR